MTFGPGSDGRTPTDVLMEYIADKRDLDLRAGGRRINESLLTSGLQDSIEIRARHCTMRAQRVWADAASVSFPPDHDPAAMIIGEIRVPRNGRVVIVSQETIQGLTTSYENAVIREAGNWRLNSRAVPRDGEWPRVIVPL